MERLRRSQYNFIVPSEKHFIDIDALLRGKVVFDTEPVLRAISLTAGRSVDLSHEALEVLLALPSNSWTPIDDLSDRQRTQVEKLASSGLIVTNRPGSPYDDHLTRHELLESLGWDPYAALFHHMTRWGQVNLEETGSDLTEPPEVLPIDTGSSRDADMTSYYANAFGKPPNHFYQAPNSTTMIDLPLVEKSSGLYAALAKRRTTRVFLQKPITFEEFSTILYYVFGCHGFSRLSPDLVLLHKTSPSGGGLHPVEVYPLVLSVEGVVEGIYHYDVEHHSVELLRQLSSDDARQTALLFVAGQSYFSSAAVLFILVSRFYRNHWKYRFNAKTFSVMLMDAAHLSQTNYLVCAELGLGAFVTGAINAQDIDSALELDGITAGAIAVLGSGRPATGVSELELVVEPYIPRSTMT